MKTVSLIDLLLSLFDSTLSVPSVMFIGMTKATEKDFETLGEAAHRLLQDLDARLKRPAAENAAQINGSPDEWSLVPGEKSGNGEALEEGVLKPFPRIRCMGGVFMQRNANSNILRLAANENCWTSEDELIFLDDDEWAW